MEAEELQERMILGGAVGCRRRLRTTLTTLLSKGNVSNLFRTCSDGPGAKPMSST